MLHMGLPKKKTKVLKSVTMVWEYCLARDTQTRHMGRGDGALKAARKVLRLQGSLCDERAGRDAGRKRISSLIP